MEPTETMPPIHLTPLDWFLKAPRLDVCEALDADPTLLADLREEIARRLLPKTLGATGDYPAGRLTDDDEGGLKLAIGSKDGQVVLAFGKKVGWFAMPPPLALAVATQIMETAHLAQGGRPS